MEVNNWKKSVTLFLASQAISLFGSSLVQYAIIWHITLQTQSGVMMTVSILCGFLPMFVLSPFSGVWADHFNRKMIIILSDSLIAVSTLVLAILFFIGYKELWLLFLASAIRAAGSGIQTPAVNAVLPQLVPEELLTKVNAVNSTIQSFVLLVSPMLSAAILAIAQIESIFFIDVVTAAIAVSVLLFFLRIPVHQRAKVKQSISYFSDLQKGVVYIKNNGYLKRLFTFVAFYLFVITPAAFLTPLQVTRRFGEEVWRLSAIEIAFSAGMMLGGLIMASWGGFKNKIKTIAAANLVFGVCTFLLGVVPVFWLYTAVMLIFGIAMPFSNTPATVMLQQKVDENYLGRVFGVYGMIHSSVMPLGMLVFGPLADAIKIDYILIVTGVLIILGGMLLSFDKILLRAGEPVTVPES